MTNIQKISICTTFFMIFFRFFSLIIRAKARARGRTSLGGMRHQRPASAATRAPGRLPEREGQKRHPERRGARRRDHLARTRAEESGGGKGGATADAEEPKREQERRNRKTPSYI